MNSKQRAYLRSLANNVNALFQIGKNGISDNFINQIDEALEARELIKLHVLENSPEDITQLANTLAQNSNSEIVQIVGNKITLFRQKNKNSKINLSK